MRNVAPDRPGSAASQKSSSVVNANPTSGSFATTTDHTCQTAKDSSSAGMESHRLRLAIWRPLLAQKPESSGRHSVNTALSERGTAAGLGHALHLGNGGSLARASPTHFALHLPDGHVHPYERTPRRGRRAP